MLFNRLRFLWITIATFTLATAIQGGIITFSGIDAGANGRPFTNSDTAAASFDTAASGIGTEGIITFETAPLGSFTNLVIATGVTANGTDFVGSPQSILNATTCTVALCGGNTTLGGSQFLLINAGTLTITFSHPQSYWGAYFGGVQADGETVNFNDGSAESLTIPDPGVNGGVNFFGFTDAGKSFTSLTINTVNPSNSLGDFISIDDMRFETGATTTPEPGTLAFVGVSLLALSAVRRKRS